jgi:hypothetical protein
MDKTKGTAMHPPILDQRLLRQVFRLVKEIVVFRTGAHFRCGMGICRIRVAFARNALLVQRFAAADE